MQNDGIVIIIIIIIIIIVVVVVVNVWRCFMNCRKAMIMRMSEPASLQQTQV